MAANRTHAWVLILTFLTLIGVGGIAQAVIDLYQDEPVQVLDLFQDEPTAENLERFAKELDRHSWFAGTLRPIVAWRRYQLVDDVGGKVLLGEDGWWFFQTGVQYMVERPVDDPKQQLGVSEAVEAIVDFRDQLAGRGIELIVMPVPGKASIYPDKLTSRLDGPVRAEATRGVIDALNAAGVHTVDLFVEFARMRAENEGKGGLLYLPRDTHWTPVCAQHAASLVAARIREADIVEEGDIDYTLNEVVVERRGDVLEMLQVPRAEESFPAIPITCRQVVDPHTQQPYQGADDSPVLVLGDSFLRIYERDDPKSAGFIAHLARQLRRPLTAIVNDGGASTLVRQQVAMRPGVLDGKKLVVWEFVERDIYYGSEGWQRVPLKEQTSKQ
jgi:hypothetical protein